MVVVLVVMFARLLNKGVVMVIVEGKYVVKMTVMLKAKMGVRMESSATQPQGATDGGVQVKVNAEGRVEMKGRIKVREGEGGVMEEVRVKVNTGRSAR